MESEKTNVLKFSDAAKFIGVSKSYLYQLTAKKKVPCYKPFGKQLFFSRLELENWLLSNKKEETA